jgi:hypothetical protein
MYIEAGYKYFCGLTKRDIHSEIHTNVFSARNFNFVNVGPSGSGDYTNVVVGAVTSVGRLGRWNSLTTSASMSACTSPSGTEIGKSGTYPSEVINPLTPELNSSAQRCVPRFFTGYFNF